MDFQAVIARIHEHLEEDHVEGAVMACLRVARASRDYVNAAIFLRELYPDKHEVVRALYDEIAPLKPGAQKYVFEFSLERWLELHTVDLATPDEDFGKPKGDRRNVLMVSAGELKADIEQSEKAIADHALPPGMGEYDTAAFTDRFISQKGALRVRIRALINLKSRLKTRCLNYAIQMERQLHVQRKSRCFLESVQNDVNNFFKVRSEDVFIKLQKACQLVDSTNTEDCALLLTEVRRALKAAADFFYPPVDGPIMCSDGKERLMGGDQYMNRLQQFVAERAVKSTSEEMLEAELEHLTTFFRRLNDMASKGVHGSVTLAESKQGLIGLYFFLFNLSQHLTKDGAVSAPAAAA